MGKTPEEMFDIRQRAIQKALADKDINIRVSWAINNATQIAVAQKNQAKREATIRIWTMIFLDLFKEVKDDVVNEVAREIEKDEEGKTTAMRDAMDEPDGHEGRIEKLL